MEIGKAQQYCYKKSLISGKRLDEIDNESIKTYINIERRYKYHTFLEILKSSIKDKEACNNLFFIKELSFALRKRKGGIKGIEDELSKFLVKLPDILRLRFLESQTLQTLESMHKTYHFHSITKSAMKIVDKVERHDKSWTNLWR